MSQLTEPQGFIQFLRYLSAVRDREPASDNQATAQLTRDGFSQRKMQNNLHIKIEHYKSYNIK